MKGKIVTFTETNNEEKILYQKGKIVELLNEEEAIKRMYIDSEDKSVIRIENHTNYDGLVDTIFELATRPVPDQLRGYDYYYCSSRFADVIEDKYDTTIYLIEGLKLTPKDNIIIEENVEPEEEGEPTIFLYSVEQDRYVGHSFIDIENICEDCLIDTVTEISAILAQEGFIDIGVYLPL